MAPTAYQCYKCDADMTAEVAAAANRVVIVELGIETEDLKPQLGGEMHIRATCANGHLNIFDIPGGKTT